MKCRRVRALLLASWTFFCASLVAGAASGQPLAAREPILRIGSALPAFAKPVVLLRYTPDGTMLVATSMDGYLYFLDARTQEIRSRIQVAPDRYPIPSIALSPDGGTLAFVENFNASLDTIRFLDLATMRTSAPLRLNSSRRGAYAGPLSFSLDGKTLMVGSSDNTVSFIDVASRREVKRWEAATGSDAFRVRIGLHEPVATPGVSYVAPVSDDSIVTGSNDGFVRLWKREGLTAKHRIDRGLDRSSSNRYLLSPDRSKIAYSDNVRHALLILESGSLRTLVRKNGVQGDGNPRRMAFSADSKILAYDDDNNSVRLIDASSGRELGHLKQSDSIHSLAFAPDARVLATGLAHSIAFWNLDTQTLSTQSLNAVPIAAVALSPGGRFIAAGTRDGRLRVWDTAPLRLVLESNGPFVSVPSFSEDGKVLGVCQSFDHRRAGREYYWRLPGNGTFEPADDVAFMFSASCRSLGASSGEPYALWRTLNEKYVLSQAEHESPLVDYLFLLDRREFLALTFYGEVKVWNVDSWQRTRSFARRDRDHYDDNACGMAASSRSNALALGNRDGSVELRSMASTDLIERFAAHAAGACAVAFSADARRLLSGGEDGAVYLWDVSAFAQP